MQDFDKPVDLPGGRSASGMMMNTLAHIDLRSGATDTWWCGPVSSLQEPAFIPRPGGTAEADGYMITIENRLAEMASRLLLFRANQLAQGPIAIAALPFRLRQGLHGNWYTDSRT